MARAAAVLLPFVLASMVLVPTAQGAAEGAPPGVGAAAWMPIAHELGFVIEQRAADPNSDSMPPAIGYFVVRRDDGWLRLDPVPQAARLRWPLRSRGEHRWIAIGDRFGFMIEAPTSEGAAEATPAAFGYFLAERAGRRLRLDPLAHAALFGGPLTANRPGVSLPITASLRFIIEQSSPRPSRAQMATARGYFMVKSAGRWLRLNPIGAGRLMRQPL